MGQIKFVAGLLMASLFGIAVLLFAMGFASDNNSAVKLQDGPGFSDTQSKISGNLSTFYTQITNASDSFYKSEIELGDTAKTGGQFKLGPATALSTISLLSVQGFKTIFGSGSQFAIVLTTLMTFLGSVLILYIWKTWGGRNPD